MGELCTRGYHVMLGYHGDTGRTAIDADGWLYCNGVAMDDRGYCRIAGRLKEMIIRGGKTSIRGRSSGCWPIIRTCRGRCRRRAG